jgi:N-acetylated-alpha-linked acidic dipeptidase
MAQADLLPYDFVALADTLHMYRGELKDLLEAKRAKATERQAALDVNAYTLTSDPRQPTVAPPALAIPPYINFAPLDNALSALDSAAAHYGKARALAQGKALSTATLAAVNLELAQAERKLTSPEGLPRRPWMQHLIYAPGWYTGYGAKTLPGVREGIEQAHYAEAEAQIMALGQAIGAEAAYVEHIAGELDQLGM